MNEKAYIYSYQETNTFCSSCNNAYFIVSQPEGVLEDINLKMMLQQSQLPYLLTKNAHYMVIAHFFISWIEGVFCIKLCSQINILSQEMDFTLY